MCLRWLTLLILLLPLSANSLSVAQSNDSAMPYLYYFSPEESAFIVERADGADRHVLYRDLLSSVDRGYLKWSSSGEWIAVSGVKCFQQHTCRSRFAEFIRADGSKWLRLSKQTTIISAADQIIWSPSADIAMVAQRIPSTMEEYELILLDVNARDVLASYVSGTVAFSFDYGVWSPDGTFFAFLQATPGGNEIVTLNINGEIIVRPTTYSTYSELLSPDGRLAYMDTDGQTLILEDVSCATKASVSLPIVLGGSVLWNHYNQTGYFGVESECAEREIWVIRLPSLSVLPLTASVGAPVDNYSIEKPCSLTLPYLSPSHTSALLHSGTLPDIQYWHFDFTNHVFEAIDLPQWEDYGVLNWQWVNDHVLRSQFLEGGFFLYDMETHSSRFIAFGGYGLEIAPNAEVVAMIHSHPALLSLITNEIIELSPHPDRSDYALAGGEIRWDEDSQWVLFFEIAATAGGGGGPRLPSVASADGQLHRPLPYRATADWLPGNLDVTVLRSPVYPNDEYLDY